MFFIVLKKMLRSKWLMLCLLTGSIAAVAMISSVPMYTSGVLQRMLTKDLEIYQADTGNYPGKYIIKQDLSRQYTENYVSQAYIETNDRITNEFADDIGLPVLSSSQILTIDNLKAYVVLAGAGMVDDDTVKDRFVKLEAVSNIESKADIVYGVFPSNIEQDGIIEIMVTEEAMKDLDLAVGNEYELTNYSDSIGHIKVRITGVFAAKDPADAFWFDGTDPYASSLIMDHDLFISRFIETKSAPISMAQWRYIFDYRHIMVYDLDRLLSAYDDQMVWVRENRGASLSMPAVNILEQYKERKDTLITILWVLQVPVLFMLIFYMFMVSKLSVEIEKGEISVLQSRGAKRLWIFGEYLIESLILAVTAFIPGIFLGYFICRFLGSSNGFLEFVKRTALDIKIGSDALIYAGAISLLAVLTMVIPAFTASKSNIVEFSRMKTRFRNVPAWKKYFADILLLGLSAYGMYIYRSRQEILELTGAKGSVIDVDPLLFLSSTFFVLGAGLLFIRLYPYLVKLIFNIGRKIWTPPLYAGFLQVARSRGQIHTLMLFLILSISIGIFNANAARTLNGNTEDRIYYLAGADMTMMAKWNKILPTYSRMDQKQYPPMSEEEAQYLASLNPNIPYDEPRFETFEDISGAEYVTKVYRRDDITVYATDRVITEVNLMGIIPDQFGKVAWFRKDLLYFHWYNYLNLLSAEPSAVFVSTALRDEYGVKLGDTVTVALSEQKYFDGVVHAFIDHWPGFDPYDPEISGADKLVIANFTYIFSKIDIEPYEVWLKKSEGVTSEQIYADMEDKYFELNWLNDAGAEIIRAKNDPMLQGTNGSLTLGFIVAMGISFLGFLIYWILSIKKRSVQFGIFRAMGMTKNNIFAIIVFEQILISGIAIIAGIIIGGICSDLFIPLLNITKNTAEQVPPFKVIVTLKDYLKVYIFAGSVLALGMAVLGIITSKIKIDQVLRMGDE